MAAGGGDAAALDWIRPHVDTRLGVFSTTRGATPLMMAAAFNNAAAVEALLDSAVDPAVQMRELSLGTQFGFGMALEIARGLGRQAAVAVLESRLGREGGP